MWTCGIACSTASARTPSPPFSSATTKGLSSVPSQHQAADEIGAAVAEESATHHLDGAQATAAAAREHIVHAAARSARHRAPGRQNGTCSCATRSALWMTRRLRPATSRRNARRRPRPAAPPGASRRSHTRPVSTRRDGRAAAPSADRPARDLPRNGRARRRGKPPRLLPTGARALLAAETRPAARRPADRPWRCTGPGAAAHWRPRPGGRESRRPPSPPRSAAGTRRRSHRRRSGSTRQ